MTDIAEPVPVTLSLDSLLADGLPPPPVDDFEQLVADLQVEITEARRRQEAHEAERLRRADKVVEDVRVQLERTREQIRILEAVRAELAGFDEPASAASERAVRAVLALEAYARRLEATLALPDLAHANARRAERIRQLLERLPERLRPEAQTSEVDATVDEMLRLGLPGSDRTVETLMESFETAVRERDAVQHLLAIARFWKHLARRGEGAQAIAARDRALQIEREVAERETRREIHERAAREAVDIRRGLEGLDQLGPEEQYAQIALWLGRLRKYQDDHEVDGSAGREIYHAFGAINAARRHLGIIRRLDALDRSFSTNWDRYITEWEARLPEARREDQLDREEDRRREAERQARERENAAEVAERAARVHAIVAELSALPGNESWRTDPEQAEEIRELLIAAVESDGTAHAEFVDAAIPFAALAQGGELRRLRRALARRGIEPDFSAAPAIPNDGDAALAALRPAWTGKRLAIVGGLPRSEVLERVRAGLDLGDARWFECFHGRDELDRAEAAIRAGAFDQVLLLVRFSGHEINRLREPCDAAGIPYRLVDRGCGVRTIARVLGEA